MAAPNNGDAWSSFLYGIPAGNHSEPAVTDGATAADGVLRPLHLPEVTLGYINTVTTISQACGAVMYRFFLKHLRLRRLFACIVVAAGLLQLTQLVLITRLNVQLGLPDVVFALGDDAVLEVTRELLAMPMLLMMAALCPDGAASTVFALLTSVQMAGQTLSGSLSSALTHALGVSLDDYSRLGLLTLACVTIRLSTLMCIGLVPDENPKELQARQATPTRPATSLEAPVLLQSDGGSGVDGALAGATPPVAGAQPSCTPSSLAPAGFFQLDEGGHVPARRAGRPIGAVLLFSLILASLVWSLTTMLSNL